MAAETFIERHGLIKYRQALRRGLPCPRRCEMVSPLPPKTPRQSRPLVCAGCDGNGVIWLASVRRMAACPLCRHSESPLAGVVSVTESDKPGERPALEIVTHSDETRAGAIGETKRATLSPHEVRRVSPGGGTRWDTRHTPCPTYRE